MMLALLIYCYANGTFFSRKIERLTHREYRSALHQSLNTQISVDVKGCGLIVGEHTTQG